MSKVEVIELCRVVVVIALVVIAAVLATPPNKVPLALRGLVRILRKDAASSLSSATGADPNHTRPGAVPTWKKLLSFGLCILAFIIAKI